PGARCQVPGARCQVPVNSSGVALAGARAFDDDTTSVAVDFLFRCPADCFYSGGGPAGGLPAGPPPAAPLAPAPPAIGVPIPAPPPISCTGCAAAPVGAFFFRNG